MLHSRPTLVSKPLVPHLSILYLVLLPPHHRPLLLGVLLRLLPPLLPLTLSGFFNGMLEVFESGALNYFTFSRLTLSTLSASTNPILTHLPLSGFLDSLLCILIVPTPGLALSLLMNPILTHLPFSGFLDSLLCVLMAPTPGLAFSLMMSPMLAAALSFSSGRAYPFLNFPPPLFLSLTLTLIM